MMWGITDINEIYKMLEAMMEWAARFAARHDCFAANKEGLESEAKALFDDFEKEVTAIYSANYDDKSNLLVPGGVGDI